ncbi:MAG: ABC transporter substrate-binding protein [Treponema sp.]|nr:ABC transporter substrate-binding protein [Treponema sp.]
MKKIIKVFCGLLVVMSLLGCTKARKTESLAARTIVDHTGAHIVIPAQINRVVIGSILPLASVYCMYMGSSEKLVGMHPSSMAAAKNSYLVKVFPDVANVDSRFVQNGAVNIEELLKLNPDVVFYAAANDEEKAVYENAGIPAIGFSTTRKEWHCIDTYADWIDLLSQIFNEDLKTARAKEIIDYGYAIERKIKDRVANLSDSQKPNVMILFNYDESNMTAAGHHFFSKYWIETPGGNNVVDAKGQLKINMEQVYQWNPDMIFITNFSPRLAEDLLTNMIDGADWSHVKAVKEKKVYKFPLGMYRWFPPASDTPLVLQWLATKIQPELFSDIDMDKEIKDYYKRFYGVDLKDDDLQAIYNPAREASGK